jgi:sigma-E factor negative regulatory protein RseB
MTLKKNRNNPIRNNITLLVVLLLAGAGYGHLATAQNTDPDALDLLNSMSAASRQLNYDGIFIYQRGGQMETMRLIHKRNENNEVERLVSLTGTAREVIRNNQSVTCIFSDDKSVVVEKSRSNKFLTSTLPESIESISDLYSFSITGDERVAGRDTWIVSIQPQDTLRYGYRLWIDKEHNLLLKSELISGSGTTLEQIMFARMMVLDFIPDELLEPSIAKAGFTLFQNADRKNESTVTVSNWRAGWMPDGFAMSDFEKQQASANSNEMDHLVYSDGLAIVSVFVEKLRQASDAMTGATNLGAVNTYAMYTNDGYQVTAVGEVPQATVQRMALSILARQ